MFRRLIRAHPKNPFRLGLAHFPAANGSPLLEIAGLFLVALRRSRSKTAPTNQKIIFELGSRIIRPGSRPPLAAWRDYAAEVGRVGFAAWAVFIAVATLGEYLWSGFLANAVSPMTLVAVAVIFGCLSLLAPLPESARTPRAARQLMLAAVALAIAVFGLTWYYLESLADRRLGLALAASYVTFAAVWLLGRVAADHD